MPTRSEDEAYNAMLSAVNRILAKLAKAGMKCDEDQKQAAHLAAIEVLPSWDRGRDLEAYLYWPVFGAIVDSYNDQMAHDAQHISIHEGEPTEDENGYVDSELPTALADCLQYDTVPEGYGDPQHEAYRMQVKDFVYGLPAEVTVILLAYFGIGEARKTLQEIAATMDIPVATLQRTVQAAIVDLRNIMDSNHLAGKNFRKLDKPPGGGL